MRIMKKRHPDAKPTPSQERLHHLFYCVDGVFIRKVRTANCTRVGDVAGHKNKAGYWYVTVDNEAFRLHRLVFKYYNGYEPGNDLDHIDGDKDNNNLWNLNDGTVEENAGNNVTFRKRGHHHYKYNNGVRFTTEEGKKYNAEREVRRRIREGKIMRWYYYFIVHNDKTVDVVLSNQLVSYCKERGYRLSRIYDVVNGNRMRHKDIISVQRQIK